MLKRTFLLTLVMAVAMLLFPGQVLAAEPIGGFWGTVAAGGDSVPDGSVVTAWIDGVKVAETQTVNSTYDFFIKGDYTEKTVVFKVGKHTAEQTAIWEQGTTQLIDLSVNAWSMQCEFYGTVNINGTHVPDGTEVSAWIDMARVQSTFTIDSMYHLIVPGNYEGQSVYFKIGSYLPILSLTGKGAKISRLI
ncbi:MAG: hypothetical protein SVM79_09330 [Chloroflexota bacterium]|nr:hypothetical protein [Chloroflexota bacterium]